MKNDPTTVARRVHEFLNVPTPTDPKELQIGHWNVIPRTTNHASTTSTPTSTTKIRQRTVQEVVVTEPKQSLETCETLSELQRRFEIHNEELYNLIEQYPGPSMEQHPFPKFNYHIKDC